MIRMRYFFIVCFLIIFSCSSKKPKLTNFFYRYHINEGLSSQSKVCLLNKTVVDIHSFISMPSAKNNISTQNFIDNIDISYVVKPEYLSSAILASDTLTSYEVSFDSVSSVYYVHFSFPLASSASVLFLQFKDKSSGESFVEDIPLGNDKQWYINEYLLLTKQGITPFPFDYLTVSDTFRIRTSSGNREKLYVYFYDFPFPPAIAPMSTTKSVIKNMQVSSLFPITSETMLCFPTPGLYFVQSDTSSSVGMGFQVEEGKYPKYTSPEYLLQPTIYISTNEEITKIASASDPKKALDDHWLEFAGNVEIAKKMIKEYYERVTFTNRIFTSFKEGWKTDRGLVYIVFGKPDKVHRTLTSEEWIYNSTAYTSSVRFRFQRMYTIFSPNHFELIRDPKYQDFWYNRVDLWRKGIF